MGAGGPPLARTGTTAAAPGPGAVPGSVALGGAITTANPCGRASLKVTGSSTVTSRPVGTHEESAAFRARLVLAKACASISEATAPARGAAAVRNVAKGAFSRPSVEGSVRGTGFSTDNGAATP